MIVTGRFVYLHLIKSGGSFVGEFLRAHIPSARMVGFHLPRHLIPVENAQLPILGFVRNPYDFYVSWYHFQAQRPHPNPLFAVLSQDKRLDFAATVRNLLDLGSGSALLDEVLEALPRDYGSGGIQLPRYALEPIRDSGRGFYAHLYSYFYGEPGEQLTIERAEELRPRLLDFLTRVGEPVSEAMRTFVTETPERNKSTHGPYVDYYSDELRELVASRDKLVIERHGYAFGRE